MCEYRNANHICARIEYRKLKVVEITVSIEAITADTLLIAPQT